MRILLPVLIETACVVILFMMISPLILPLLGIALIAYVLWLCLEASSRG